MKAKFLASWIAVAVVILAGYVGSPSCLGDYLAAPSVPYLVSVTPSPVSPARAARITEAYALEVSDIDTSTGLATLTFSYQTAGRGAGGSVRMNLITGRFSVLKPGGARALPSSGCSTHDTLPSRNFVLDCTADGSKRIVVRDKKGRTLSELTEEDVPGISDVVCRRSGDYFAFLGKVKGTESESAMFVYSIRERKSHQLVRGVFVTPRWSHDGRYLACVRQSSAAKRAGEQVGLRDGAITVLDVVHGFRTVLTVGQVAAVPAFSPHCDKIAFAELARDEYGDMANSVIRVADLRTRKVRDLVRNRRLVRFSWAGNDALALTTMNKFAVPTLSLMSVDSGNTTILATMPEFAALVPVVYLSQVKRVILVARKDARYGERPDELWAVEPGRKPVRLFPKNVGVGR